MQSSGRFDSGAALTVSVCGMVKKPATPMTITVVPTSQLTTAEMIAPNPTMAQPRNLLLDIGLSFHTELTARCLFLIAIGGFIHLARVSLQAYVLLITGRRA